MPANAPPSTVRNTECEGPITTSKIRLMSHSKAGTAHQHSFCLRCPNCHAVVLYQDMVTCAFSSPTQSCFLLPCSSTLRVPSSYGNFTTLSRHRTQQLTLQDKLAFFVLLTRLISLIVLPPHRLATLTAQYIAYDVAACSHVSFHCFCLFDIHDCREEERFTVLTTKVARDDVVEVGKVGFTTL